MGVLWQDIRYGLRMLARTPGFTAVVVLILAVAIGANTAVFSVVNAVALKPFPYRDADRIVTLWEQSKWGPGPPSHQDFLTWYRRSQVFEDVAAYARQRFYVVGIDKSREVWANAVSANLLPLLGIKPLLGRTFRPEEEQPGNDEVVVLSHRFWMDRLGADPNALGRTISLTSDEMNRDTSLSFERRDYTIVGVMPAGFEFPFGRPAPFWVPLVFKRDSIWEEGRPAHPIARLKRGVTLEQARAEMAVLTERARQAQPKTRADRKIELDRMQNRVLAGKTHGLLLLLGAAGFVLLIACGNVANLFLARAAARQHELATRMVLGASRGRVLQQILTESLLLTTAAGLAGLLLTFLTVKGLVSLCPADNIPRLGQASVDGTVLGFTLGVSILTGLLFGTMPAWRAVDTRASQSLKSGWTRPSITRQRRRLRGSLVILQIALSLILLVGATLLIRSLIALHHMDLGFRPENVLTAHIGLPAAKYPDGKHCQVFYDELIERVRHLPRVRSAALVRACLQLGELEGELPFSVPGHPVPDGQEPPLAKWTCLSPGFFQTLGIPIVKGRDLTEQDQTNHIVIDETLANRYFPDDDPIGRVLVQSGYELTIVGVARTTRDFLTPNPPEGTIYMHLAASFPDMIFLVRTDDDPILLAPLLRQQIGALSQEEVVTRMETLETTLSDSLAARRFVMILLGVFAGLALIVAMIGVYGLLQYSTAQQTHDIGVRMALGAREKDVLTAVLGQGVRLALIGVAAGTIGALALTRVLSSLLYDVSPTDPATLAGVSIVLASVALLASYLPARRAAKIDPMEALRYE